MTKERAREMVLELLQKEEAQDTFNLTRAERREFQQMVERAMTGTVLSEESAKHITEENGTVRLHVQTPEGELRAYLGGDPEYPNISVMLNPTGTSYEVNMAVVESSPIEGLRTIVWGNAMEEDYTKMIPLENLEEHKKLYKDDEIER